VADDYNLPSAHCGNCGCDRVRAVNTPVVRVPCVCGRVVPILKSGRLRKHWIQGSDSEECAEQWPPTL
jgi:hypothetical protein